MATHSHARTSPVALTTFEAGVAPEAVARRRIHPTVAYIGRRFGLYLISLWGAFTASFIFFRLIPGDPISAIINQLSSKGQYSSQSGSQDVSAYYKKAFGLDGSLLEQYLRYMQRLVIHQDFGPSIVSYPSSAMDIILRSLPWTIGLLGSATLLAWIVGVVGGTFVGWARRSRIGGAITNVALLLSHVPAYFVALFFVIFLAYRNPIFPPNGAYSASVEKGWNWDFISSVIKHGTLPVLATALVGASFWLITTRALVINVLGEDYLTYADAKGLSPWRILNRYVMRNAWLPQISALGIAMGGVINGNVLVERLFRYPGVGNLLIDAINVKDVNTAQGIIAMLMFLVLTLNLIIDLCLPLLDPRVKLAR
jgi:peptide/nickel transport system permease protein